MPAALPHDAQGRAAVLVIGFSKAAAKVTRPWLENCRSETSVTCYDIRMVEDVPRVFRGMMERGMRSGLPVELQRRTVLVYTENDAWRQRVGVADDKTAHVVGCDKEGRVRGVVTGPFAETELKKLMTAIEPSATTN